MAGRQPTAGNRQTPQIKIKGTSRAAVRYTQADKAATVYEDASSGPYPRTRPTVRALFGGLPLLDPGDVVWTSQWHPDAETPPVNSPGGASLWCGIGRKP